MRRDDLSVSVKTGGQGKDAAGLQCPRSAELQLCTVRARYSCRAGALRSFALALLALVVCLAGCTGPKPSPEQRYAGAKALFDQTTKNFHVPSAEAKGEEKVRLQNQAAAGYTQLLRQYRDEPYWCAQALRSLGNIRATQGKLDEAVRHYAAVGDRYPQQDWEVLQAWKSAADLLWDAGRRAEAAGFYRKIIERYDQPDAVSVVKLIVRGSKSRLAE